MDKNKGKEEFISSKDLAKRWQVSELTIKRMRKVNDGPYYLKVGMHINSKILYRLKDIINYEKINRLKTRAKNEKVS